MEGLSDTLADVTDILSSTDEPVQLLTLLGPPGIGTFPSILFSTLLSSFIQLDEARHLYQHIVCPVAKTHLFWELQSWCNMYGRYVQAKHLCWWQLKYAVSKCHG